MTGAEGDGNSTEVERQVVGRNIYRKAVFNSFFLPKLSNQALNQTRKTGYQKSEN